MARSIENGRWNATFRPGGLVRFFGTGVITAWLGAWVVGEAYAAGILLASLGVPGGAAWLNLLGLLAGRIAPALAERLAWRDFPTPANADTFALAFITTWIAVWTVAGLVAAWQLLRLHASEDRVEWDDSGVTVHRRVGPFRARKTWRAERIEHVSLGRSDRTLTLHTTRGARVLTEWGSKAERAAVCEEVRAAFGLAAAEGTRRRMGKRAEAKPRDRRKPALKLIRGAGARAGAGPPAGWVALPAEDGATRLVRDPAARRARVLGAWTATAALAAAAVTAYGSGAMDVGWAPEVALAALAILAIVLAAGRSAWLTFADTEIVVRPRAIEVCPGLRASRVLDPVRFSVEHSTDSDGDDWFELHARAGFEHVVLERRMNESEPVLALAHWLARQSAAPLDLGRGVADLGDEPMARAA